MGKKIVCPEQIHPLVRCDTGEMIDDQEKYMLEDFELSVIVEPLLEWYENNKRTLPWREAVSPYRVWISEIMLQQTRVEAVKPYFERFINVLPTIQALAECPEEQLLKLWEGLGYYNRVRNMQKAAQTVMEEYGGKLPADYEELLKLKGIGHYTAGAIASIAYGIPVPAVDGNVLRVIMRLTGDDSDIMKQSVKTKVENALLPVMPQDAAGAFNQALMELGATVCVPNGAPNCEACPWQSFCLACKNGSFDRLPVKSKAKPRKIEARTVLLIRDGENVVLNKRPQKGLLAGLYEFPNVLGKLTREEALRQVRQMGLHPLHIKELENAVHIFSHVEWHMAGYMIQVDSLTRNESDLLFAEIEEAEEKYAIPSAFAAYTRQLNLRLGIK